MNALLIVVALFAAIWVCAYHRYTALGWTAVIAVGLGALTSKGDLAQSALIVLWAVFAIGAALVNPTPLRRALLSAQLLGLFRRLLPQMSQTERHALAGCPCWSRE